MAQDPQSKKRQFELAKLLVEGSKTIPEAYQIAYKDLLEQNPTENDAQMVNRAYRAADTKGVQTYVKMLQEKAAIEEARLLVWDKRKASKYLLDRCGEVEVNMNIIRNLRNTLMGDKTITDIKKLQLMQSISLSMNDTARTMKDIAVEMNKMYGLQDPKVSIGQAVQVIIGSKAKDMPDDTLDYED